MKKTSTLFALILSLFLTSCSMETFHEYYIFDGKGNNTYTFSEKQIEEPTYALFLNSLTLNVTHVVKGKDLFESLNIKSPMKINKISEEETNNIKFLKDENIFYFIYTKTISYPFLFSEDFENLILKKGNSYYKLDLTSSSILSIYNYVIEYGAFVPNTSFLF